jgi:hypothetical protein
MFAYVSKSIFAHLSITINKQFALVTLLEWVFGYPLIRQRIVVIGYVYWLHGYAVMWLCGYTVRRLYG